MGMPWRIWPHIIGSVLIAMLVYPWIAWAQPVAAMASGWMDPVNLSQSTADSTSPAAVVVNGRLHVVWEEDGQLYHRYQTDTGWSATVAIGSGSEPALAADGNGQLHLVYVDVFGGNAEILYRSWKAGNGWTAAVNVSRTTAASATPDIAVSSDGRLHVVWVDDALTDPWVFYAASSDGLVWESSPVSDAFGTGPQIAVDAAGRPHVLWVEPYSFDDPLEVFYSRWTGSEWTLPEDVSNTPTANSTKGVLVLDAKDTPWATWQEKVNGRWQVWTAPRLTTGWGAPSVLAQAGNDLTEPVLAAGSQLVQAWVISDTLQVRWFDGRWGAPETIWQDPDGITQPVLAPDTGGDVWAVWSSPDDTGAGEIFASRGKWMRFRLYLPMQVRRVP